MDLEHTMLRHKSHLREMFRTGAPTESALVGAGVGGGGGIGVTANGDRTSFGSDGNVLELDSGDGYISPKDTQRPTELHTLNGPTLW